MWEKAPAADEAGSTPTPTTGSTADTRGNYLSEMKLAPGDVVVCTEKGMDYVVGEEGLIHLDDCLGLVVSKLPLSNRRDADKKFSQLNVSRFKKKEKVVNKEEPAGQFLADMDLQEGDVVICVDNGYFFLRGSRAVVEANSNGDLMVTTQSITGYNDCIKIGKVNSSKFVKEETPMTNNIISHTALANNTLPYGLMSNDDKSKLMELHHKNGYSLRFNSAGQWEKISIIRALNNVFRPLPESKVVNHKYFVNNKTGLMTKSKPAAPTTEITIQITIDGIGNLNTKVL